MRSAPPEYVQYSSPRCTFLRRNARPLPLVPSRHLSRQTTDNLDHVHIPSVLSRPSVGYKGLVIVIDEAETILRTRGDVRGKSLNGIRQIIDAADRYKGLLWVFTGTPEFFDSRRGVAGLQPLHDRIQFLTEGGLVTMRQPQLELKPFDRERLKDVGLRLRQLYPMGDPNIVAQKVTPERIASLVDEVTKGFRGDVGVVPRQFLRRLVNLFDTVAENPDAALPEPPPTEVENSDRIVTVREAPRGVKPSWGGFIPQHLGFELSQRIKRVLTESIRYPYVDETGYQHLEAKRADLADLLSRPGPAIQLDEGRAHLWTFAGGRINHTLKYGLELSEGWKVIADNFQLRIEGDGVDHSTVRRALTRISDAEYWNDAATRRALLARLPGYRLSKFQDCLPEPYALEVVERYLLDVEAAVRWLETIADDREQQVRANISLRNGSLLT